MGTLDISKLDHIASILDWIEPQPIDQTNVDLVVEKTIGSYKYIILLYYTNY